MGIIITDGRRVWDGTIGGKMILWEEAAVLTGRFIKREKLAGHRFNLYLGKKRIRIPRWFPGIPVPHMHYQGKVYPMTKTQWSKYSSAVVKDLRVKMGKIKTVDLEGLATMATAIKIAKKRR
jgi:hypothetical protein